MLAAALTGFHSHYLTNFAFVSALAIFHLLFRRSCFDRRAWAIAISLGMIYVGQAIWYGHFDPNTYTQMNSPETSFGGTLVKLIKLVGLNLLGMNSNGILSWTVVVALLGWRIIAMRKKFSEPSQSSLPHSPNGLAIGPSEVAWQYLVLVLIIITCLSITIAISSSFVGYGTRFLIALAPFAAVPSAELLALIWRHSRLLSLSIAAVLVCTNVAGWPFAQHSFYGNKIRLTMPTLIAEFQQEYPYPMRTVVAHLRANAKQDDLVYTNKLSETSRLIFYLGDKLLIGGILARNNKLPATLDASKRAYLFEDEVMARFNSAGLDCLFGSTA